MGENTIYLSAEQSVPDVRIYSLFVKIDVFDPKEFWRAVRGRRNLSWLLGGFKKKPKIWNKSDVLMVFQQNLNFDENLGVPKSSTRSARPLRKYLKTLCSIMRGPHNTEKYLRTSGTHLKILT